MITIARAGRAMKTGAAAVSGPSPRTQRPRSPPANPARALAVGRTAGDAAAARLARINHLKGLAWRWGLVAVMVFAPSAQARSAEPVAHGVSGTVLSPQGDAVEGAEVIAATPKLAAWPNVTPHRRTAKQRGAASTLTDKAGRFSLELPEDAGVVSIHHPLGVLGNPAARARRVGNRDVGTVVPGRGGGEGRREAGARGPDGFARRQSVLHRRVAHQVRLRYPD